MPRSELRRNNVTDGDHFGLIQQRVIPGRAKKREPAIHNHRSLGVLFCCVFCKVGGYGFRRSLAKLARPE
jgi:hypothetical protein